MVIRGLSRESRASLEAKIDEQMELDARSISFLIVF